MDLSQVEQAVELLEKANAELQPELLPAAVADKLLAAYARAEKLAGYGVAALAAKRNDACELARITGTSIGKARTVVATGMALPASGSSPRRSSRATSLSIKRVRSRPRKGPRRGLPGHRDLRLRLATTVPM
jgi:hypothetical protein